MKQGVIGGLGQSIAGHVRQNRAGAGSREVFSTRGWCWGGRGSGKSQQHFEPFLEAGREEISQI